MLPFERLRHLARSVDDERILATEAADCLAAFDDDPAGIVVACRRLLEHQPASPLLWWLCARVLTAPDPSDAAWEAEGLLRDDPTPDRLAGVLPFPPEQPIAVLGWPELTAETLASRPDLEVLVVRSPGDGDWSRRLARSTASARPVSVAEAVACEPSHVLLEIVAASDTEVLVPVGTRSVLDDLTHGGPEVWLVAGVGRVLPARLFAAMITKVGDLDAVGLEPFDVHVAARIAGPNGLERPEGIGRLIDAPVAPELLRGV